MLDASYLNESDNDMLLKQSARHVFEALKSMIERYEEAEDKEEFCNPDAPLLINVNGKRNYVLSVGGDPDEEGFVIEAKPESQWR